MSINLIIPASFSKLADDKSTVAVHGKTIGQCLVDLIQQYPGIKEKLFYGGREGLLAVEGKLWSKIEVLLNVKPVTRNNILTTSVEDDDKLQIKINTR